MTQAENETWELAVVLDISACAGRGRNVLDGYFAVVHAVQHFRITSFAIQSNADQAQPLLSVDAVDAPEIICALEEYPALIA